MTPMKTLLALMTAVVISGCATRTAMKLPQMVTTNSDVKVSAIRFTVIDVSQKSGGEMVFVGFERDSNDTFEPSPPQMVKSMLETKVKVTGSGDAVEVLILDAGTYSQILAADRVPFLNAFSFGMMERSSSCKATVVVKNNVRNIRKEFEHVNKPTVVQGIDGFLREIVKCQDDLTTKIAEEIDSLLKQ